MGKRDPSCLSSSIRGETWPRFAEVLWFGGYRRPSANPRWPLGSGDPIVANATPRSTATPNPWGSTESGRGQNLTRNPRGTGGPIRPPAQRLQGCQRRR